MTYLVTKEIHEALSKYQWLASVYKLGLVGSRDDREMTRLLGNTNYSHITALLEFFENYGPKAGELSTTILETNNQMNLQGTLAELYLFAFLEDRFNGNVKSTSLKSHIRTADIEVRLKDVKAIIEVFSPIDFYAFQLFENSIMSILKNLQVHVGYKIHIRQQARDNFYALDFPNYKMVSKWLKEFEDSIVPWILSAKDGSYLDISGPENILDLHITVEELHADPAKRTIMSSHSTRSTDTSLSFEQFDRATAKDSLWFKKINGKFSKQQAGSPEEGTIRILAINFRYTDTSDFSFLKRSTTSENIEKLIRFASEGISPFPPYEAVIPCVLDFESGFAVATILGTTNFELIRKTISSLEMDKPIREIPTMSYSDWVKANHS